MYWYIYIFNNNNTPLIKGIEEVQYECKEKGISFILMIKDDTSSNIKVLSVIYVMHQYDYNMQELNSFKTILICFNFNFSWGTWRKIDSLKKDLIFQKLLNSCSKNSIQKCLNNILFTYNLVHIVIIIISVYA